MSTPAPTPTPAATPAPATPSAPAVPVTPSVDPKARHPGVSKLMQSLAAVVPPEDKTENETPPETSPKPEETKPAAPVPAAAAPAAPETPIKVRKKKIERPPLPTAPVQHTAPTAPAAPAAVDDADLEESERQAIKDSEELERRFSDKHKGLGDRTKNFIREHVAYIKRQGDNFDPEDPEYKTWIEAHRPRVTQQDYEELRTARIVERATQESEKKLADVHHEIFVRDEQPKIEAEAGRMFNELAFSALPENIRTELTEAQKRLGTQKGFEELQQQYGLEFTAAEHVLNLATNDLKEFMKITRTDPRTGRALVEFNPANDQHQRLSKMVLELCETFKNSGGKDLQRDGKWFVTRDEWNTMPAGERYKYWTFSNDDIVKRAKAMIPNSVSQVIDHERQRMAKIGWQPPQRKAAPVANPPPTPPAANTPPPAPRPAPLPSSGTGPASNLDPRTRTIMGNLKLAG